MPKHRQTGIILLLVSAIGLLMLGGLLVYSSMQRPAVISVDGRQITLRGTFDNVGQAVEAAGIELRQEDSIWPSQESSIPAEGVITVNSARPVELTVDGQTEKRWTLQNNLASFLAEQGIALSRSSVVLVDGERVSWPARTDDLVATRLGQTVDISSLVEVQIDDGQDSLAFATQATTVGRSLIDAGIAIYAADHVEPSLSSWLHPGDHIVIERATPVTVNLNEQDLTARTSRQDVAGALADMGVGLIGRDQTSLKLDARLGVNQQITVERASTTYALTESSLPFSSRMVPLDTLEIDQRSLVSAGAPGTLSQVTRIETLGSDTISETVVGEWISQPPVDEVIGYGTDIVVRTLDTPEGPLSYWRVVRMRVSAYTAADAGKSPSHPAYGITASGRPAGYGVVAIDPNVVPFRSQVYVPGYGVGLAGDTGGGVRGRWIDLGYDEGEIESWRGYVDVYYLTPVPEPDRINYLIPTTLP